MKQGISVIVPFLNEEENIVKFCDELERFRLQTDFPIELVFVDDGSKDQSVKILSEYQFQNIERYKIISLSKNFGSHAAIRAGIMNASFDYCTWLGMDLQEPLELLNIGYHNLTNGYNSVFIEKEEVDVGKLERLFSKIYSGLMIRFAVRDYGNGGISTICFDGKVKQYLNENVESNSSIHLQIINAGFQNITYPMKFHARNAGKSKWSLSKKVKLFIDSFVAFSFMPIRLVSIIGILMFLAGIVSGMYTIVGRLIHSNDAVAGYATIATLLALGFGITNISLGIIAEYLWRTYDAASGRPAYIIADIKQYETGKKLVQDVAERQMRDVQADAAVLPIDGASR